LLEIAGRMLLNGWLMVRRAARRHDADMLRRVRLNHVDRLRLGVRDGHLLMGGRRRRRRRRRRLAGDDDRPGP